MSQKRVYMDNGATTMVAPEVAKAMLPFFSEKYGNASSLHQFGREAKNALEDAREVIAKSINAEPSEIIFTSGGSESDNMALNGAANTLKEKGNHIITTGIEHPAILSACKELAKDGFKITYLGVDKTGLIDLDKLRAAITNQTILVSVIHANNEIGVIQDLEEIGRICKDKGILLHTDAVQSLTKAPLDVKKMNIALASFSAHKIHGPKGIGALFIRKGVNIKKLVHGGHQENELRAGTENIPGAVGFAKAVELATGGHITKMKELRDYLIEELLKIPHTQLNGHREKRLCNNANISFHFIEGESILLQLDMKGIAVSTGSACSSQSLQASHVLLALGMKHEIAHGTIRFTISRYTTKSEVDYVIENVKEVVSRLRQMSPLKEGYVYTAKDDGHGHEH